MGEVRLYSVEGDLRMSWVEHVLVTEEQMEEFKERWARRYEDRERPDVRPEYFWERVAEDSAEEAAPPHNEWDDDNDVSWFAQRVATTGDDFDPEGYLKTYVVWNTVTGKEATVEDLLATRLNSRGEPIPPPPIKGQLDLDGNAVE